MHLVLLYAADLARADDFTVIVLPDTQYYTCDDGGACVADLGIFESQTAWIAANRDALDIRFVTGVGDCVEDGDQQPQFDLADAAISVLEDAVEPDFPEGIPYGLAVGNHDQDPKSDPGSIPDSSQVLHPDQGETTELFNATFGLDRFCPGSVCRGYYGDHFGSNNDNHYDLFSAGEYDFVIVHLEYMPVDAPLRRAVIAWADQVLTRYSDRRAIVVSHYLIKTGTGAAFGDQGAAVYEGLKHHPNLFLMLSGHVPGEGRRTDVFDGNTVQTLMADYQGRVDGGQGFLRILRFDPETDTIAVRTYSPWLDTYEIDGSSEFVVDYDLGGGNPDPHASFQQGVDGYAGASDTWIAEGTGAHGAEPTLAWGGGGGAATLLRFGGLFDTEGGPIPAGSEIVSAVLHYVTDEEGSDATLQEATAAWTDAVDHAGFGPVPGAQAGEDYDPTPVAELPGGAGVHAVDVTASVAGWSADPARNHGWVVVSAGSSEARIRSGDHGEAGDRPRLAVRWRAVEPGTVVLRDLESAYVSSASPDARFTGVLEVDTASAFKHAFVRPSHLGSLKPGDRVARAELVLPIVDPGDDVELREVLEDWDLDTLSWSDVPATGPALTTLPGSPTGEVAVDLTALVQSWVDGAPAHGVNLYPTGSNGVDLGADLRLVVQLTEDGGGECADADADAHEDSSCGGTDCDDADPTVHPGATEVCDDPVDQDCDGAADCPVVPRTVVLTDVDDAHVSSAAPSTRLGTAGTLEIDAAPAQMHALIEPRHLADIPLGAQVDRATLELRVSNAGDPVQLRELLGAWDEGAVTWETAPISGAPLATFSAPSGGISVDVTALVQRWVNGAPLHGLGLYPTGGNGVDLRSSEHADASLRPRFVVEVLDGAPACGDADGDGHLDQGCGGLDCDDADPTVHPGAAEVCDDPVDQDCDGAADCPAVPRSVVLSAIDDTYVADATPGTNFGGAVRLEVDTASTFKQAFLAPADLGDIGPGARVVRAELVLRVLDPGSEVEVREVLAAWEEGAVTWRTAPATGAPLTSFAGATGEVSVDLTALVQRWVDGAPIHGVALYPTGSNGVDLASAEHADSTARPYLVVEVVE